MNLVFLCAVNAYSTIHLSIRSSSFDHWLEIVFYRFLLAASHSCNFVDRITSISVEIRFLILRIGIL